LIIPAVLLILSFAYLGFFYYQNNDIIYKDVSLTGGTSITIFTSEISPKQLTDSLSNNFKNFEVRSLSDNSGKQTRLIVTIQEESPDLEKAIETFLGYQLTTENSSKETTSSSLSGDFYKQLMVSVLLAFFWMAAVVFIIFAKGKKVKFWTILLNILLGFLLGTLQRSSNPLIYAILIVVILVSLIYIYIKNSVPSFAVMSCAFADIIMTLAVVDLMGMKLSSAGIVAFLMLIGYSVDTDILLTTRALKKREGTLNHRILGAFKTGILMTITALVAVFPAFFIVTGLPDSFRQIFLILGLGLSADIINTWLTNASIIKWYCEKKGIQ